MEKYITRCFNSIIKQSFIGIECIFIDDCSSDNSIDILYGLIKDYTGNVSFKIIKHGENGGLSAARNTGIKNAKGEYIYFLDSDDEITEHCIKYLVELAEKYENVDIVQGNTIREPRISCYYWDISKRHFPEYTNNRLWLKKHFFVFPQIPVNACNKLIKRSFIIGNRLYFREGILYEDRHWNYFIAKKINSMAFNNYYCYIYYDNPESIMGSNNNLRSLQSWLIIIRDMLENVDKEFQREEKKYIYSILCIRMNYINATEESISMLSAYRSIICVCIKGALRSLDFRSCLGLLIFLLPYQVYNNIFAKMLSKLLFANWEEIFSLNWYAYNLRTWGKN
jgi:glycosyltransferase involved in cell wall biosynthesis